jgi:hypothetical protein
MKLFVKLLARANARNESGMTTAELLGNAALGIGVLVVIWGALRVLGLNVVTWIGSQIGVG